MNIWLKSLRNFSASLDMEFHPWEQSILKLIHTYFPSLWVLSKGYNFRHIPVSCGPHERRKNLGGMCMIQSLSIMSKTWISAVALILRFSRKRWDSMTYFSLRMTPGIILDNMNLFCISDGIQENNLLFLVHFATLGKLAIAHMLWITAGGTRMACLFMCVKLKTITLML